MPSFASTKTYSHEVGLSTCFRQWRADSHCRFLHGYALAVRVEFRASHLDARHWVMDFGALKPFKQWLADTFDHKLLVAHDDPQAEALRELATLGVADVVWVDHTGCEAFAKLILDNLSRWLEAEGHAPRVSVHSVEVREHGANSGVAYA